MLSISPPIKGRGGADYYLTLAREDYYTQGGEPPGEWLGEGARLLRLKGNVEKEALRALLDGFSANGRTALVQNAGSEDRQSGWDLTFSAPKSVSVFWSQAPSEICQVIQAAQAEAVEEAIDYLQQVAGLTRRGRGGEHVEAAKLVAAAFEHGTSREQDPQLHTHVVLLNLGIRSDGTTGSIRSDQVFEHKMAAGALYRAELAARLHQKLGLRIERDGEFFQIRGVSEELCAEFSKRRHQIENALAERGLDGAVAASVAALDTRAAKDVLPREQLFPEWQQTGRSFGWSTEQAQLLLNQQGHDLDLAAARQGALREAMSTLAEKPGPFTKQALMQALAEAAPSYGLDAQDVRWMAKSRLAEDDIVAVGKGFRARYTTKDVVALEDAIQASIDREATTDRACVTKETLRDVLGAHPELSEHQRIMLEQIVGEPGAIQTTSSLRRSEQIQVVRAAREAWEMDHIPVRGVAPDERTALVFESKTGIETRPLDKLLLEGLGMELRLKEKSLLRTQTHLPHLEIKIPHLQLGLKNSILVADRADELSPWKRHEVVLAHQWGIKLVLVTSTRKPDKVAERTHATGRPDRGARLGLRTSITSEQHRQEPAHDQRRQHQRRDHQTISP